jgi:hypothetical protein
MAGATNGLATVPGLSQLAEGKRAAGRGLCR